MAMLKIPCWQHYYIDHKYYKYFYLRLKMQMESLYFTKLQRAVKPN